MERMANEGGQVLVGRSRALNLTGWLMLALALVLSMAVTAPRASFAADFLDPADAFKFSARMVDKDHVEVHYVIAKGYYLYKDRFHFAAEPASVVVGTPEYSKPPEIKFDETFGKNVEHYRDDVTIRLPVSSSAPFTFVSTAQGCADAGLCYPPQEARASLDPSSAAAASAGTGPVAATASGENTGSAFESGQMSSISAALKGGNLLWIAVVFLGLGLLLSLTPCVWPMIPILSSIIAGNDAEHLTRARGFFLALAYSLGIAAVYTSLGVAAGLAGEGLAMALQRPAVQIVFALALAGLSLSMFNVYQLQMPAAIQNRLNAASNNAEGGRLIGVFFMGAVSALVVGPCVAAPLAGTLLYISQTRDVLIGAVALFCLGIGTCVPLLVLGFWEGAMLPRAGAWMESVKRVFGVLLLAVAIYMASPALPPAMTLLLWAVLLIVSAVYMHAFDAVPTGASGWHRLSKGFGLVLFVCGVAQVVGASTGASDPTRPLGSIAMHQGAAPPSRLAFQTIHSGAELDQTLALGGKPVMLDFTADWCVACKEMERDTYTDKRVEAALSKFTLVKADVTGNSSEERALLKRFSLFGPPGIMFFSADGKPLPQATVIGYQDADSFLGSLARALA
jgi:thiol:disulfide interchange protein DsbD